MSEARTGKRFPLRLPIIIRDKSSSKKHRGTTSNVSAAGVYIWANAAFEVGSRIRFEIMLPGKIIGMGKDVAIQCTGRVVRTEADHRKGRKLQGKIRDRRRGVACVIDSYKFLRR